MTNKEQNLKQRFSRLLKQMWDLSFEFLLSIRPFLVAGSTTVLLALEVFITNTKWQIIVFLIGTIIVFFCAWLEHRFKPLDINDISEIRSDAFIQYKQIQGTYNDSLNSGLFEIEKAIVFLKNKDFANAITKTNAAQNILLGVLVNIAEDVTPDKKPMVEAVLTVVCEEGQNKVLKPVYIGEVRNFPTFTVIDKGLPVNNNIPPVKAYIKSYNSNSSTYVQSNSCQRIQDFKRNPKIQSIVSFPLLGEREGQTVVTGVLNIVSDERGMYTKKDVNQMCDFNSSILVALSTAVTLYRTIQKIEIYEQSLLET